MSDNTTTTDQATTSKDATTSVEWEQATSRKGAEYRVGRLKGEASTQPKDKESITTLSRKGISVDWPVSSSDDWVATTQAVHQATGIWRYHLGKSQVFLDYSLDFSNDVSNDYYFFDQSGDVYHCNTWLHDDHFVNYSSKQPKIVWIEWE